MTDYSRSPRSIGFDWNYNAIKGYIAGQRFKWVYFNPQY